MNWGIRARAPHASRDRRLVGTQRVEVLQGGNDRLSGGGGDYLVGGSGHDRLNRGPGDDTAEAAKGDVTRGCERATKLRRR